MSNFNAERKGIATQAIRLARICCEDAWAHAVTRETFGRPLIENPVIRDKFVRMGRVIEPAQAFLEQLTWLIEESRKKGEKEGSNGMRCVSFLFFFQTMILFITQSRYYV